MKKQRAAGQACLLEDNETPPFLEGSAVHMAHARVLGSEGELFVIATSGGEIRMAARAHGCLLLPQKGDLVLVSLAAAAASHVLCVLEKENPEAAQHSIDLGPGAGLSNRSGELSLHGKSLHCSAQERASITAPDLEVKAATARAGFTSCSLATLRLTAVADTARFTARKLEQQAGRLLQRLGSSFRRIGKMEHVIAERIALHVNERLTQKAKNASLEAQQNVTINGEHIDVG